DGGATWAEAGRVPEVGFDNAVRTAVLGPDGRVYVGLSGRPPLYEGAWVWRTAEAVPVSAEPGPTEKPEGLGLSVRPNPAGDTAAVVLTLPEAGEVAAWSLSEVEVVLY